MQQSQILDEAGAKAWPRQSMSWQFALWTFIGLLSASQYYSFYRFENERFPLWRLMMWQMPGWYLWGLLTPLILPHFLFNTLHNISALVRKKENQTAVRMISGLSDLLRYVLRQNEAQAISLRQELDFIEQYLEIERLRFQDRMKVQINVAEETLDAEVPNLILQPLVENAIRHGIAGRADAGLVEIRSWRSKDTLWLEVRDDGPGISNDPQIANGAGLGLKNTRARLKQIYGEVHSFELQNAESVGAVAKLGIPFNTP